MVDYCSRSPSVPWRRCWGEDDSHPFSAVVRLSDCLCYGLRCLDCLVDSFLRHVNAITAI